MSVLRNFIAILFILLEALPYTIAQGCGGVLESNAGAIIYKLGERYSNMEKCVWTIVAQNRSTIELQLVQDGLYSGPSSNPDMLSIYGLNSKNELEGLADIFAGDRELHIFPNQLIYISFTTDLYNFGNGTGFLISFRATGPEVKNPLSFEVHHIVEQYGLFYHIPSGNKPELISYTFNAVNHTRDNLLELTTQSFYTGEDPSYRFCHSPLNMYEFGQGFIFKRLGLCGFHPPVVISSPSPLIVTIYHNYTVQAGFSWALQRNVSSLDSI